MSKESHKALAKSQYLFPSRTDLTVEEMAPLGLVQMGIHRLMVEKGPITLWHHLAPIELNNVKNESVQSVVAGKMTPEAAAKKMQETFEKILKQQ
jgi:ABC-type glycerol-3-phosphate transport system substrate-binding protein